MAEEYHVENFGCRANRADGEDLASGLRNRGLIPAHSAADADLVVINTCSVTAQADRSARAFVRRVHRQNPGARILVTGCYAQRAPGEIAALAGVHAVIGNSHKPLLPDLAAGLAADLAADQAPAAGFVALETIQGTLKETIDGTINDTSKGSIKGSSKGSSKGEALKRTPEPWAGPSIYVDEVFAHSSPAMAFYPAAFFPTPAAAPNGTERPRTRPNLKVQDGCGNRCSFCVIPATRGPSRSMSLEACLRSAEAFVAGGGKELVLSGINLGRWGRDLTPPGTLEQLVSAILSETSLERLRLSSIEPMDWTAELLSLFRKYSEPLNPRLARHAHLPLQSGSDAILRGMHRRYRPWHYAEKLKAIRRDMPDAAIGADVMVGFPGESDALFEESLSFIRDQPFTYLHLFPFSPRPGTSAWSLHRQSPVPPRAVEERMDCLRRLIRAKNLAFRQSFIGRRLAAITLNTPEDEQRRGFTRALTDNFLALEIQGRLAANQAVRAVVSAVREADMEAGMGSDLSGSLAIQDSATQDSATPDSATRDSATRDSATRDSATPQDSVTPRFGNPKIR